MNERHSHIHTADYGTEIMQSLKKNGFRQTPQRRIVLKVFLEMKGHPSTEEIHEEIQRRGYKTSMATTYRTIKALVETGMVRKLEFGDGQGRYERHEGRGQHLHLVCERCGRTFEAPTDTVDALFEGLAEDRAFALHSHTTYLYGLCGMCRPTSTSTKNQD